jgi:hypothetical protein
MIYGELGRYPLYIDIKQRMVSYWTKLITGKQSKICSVVYRLMYHLCNTQNANFYWLNSVKTILDECGFSYIWETQIFISEVWLKFNIKMRLHDKFQQTWRETLHNCSKTLNYCIFKYIYIKKRYTNRPNIINFLGIMASTNRLNVSNLCKFIRIINERVCPPS